MRDLKFQGAMIHGQTNGDYLDLDKYSVFWERAAALQAPIYLHPANPVDHPAVYAGHPELNGSGIAVWTYAGILKCNVPVVVVVNSRLPSPYQTAGDIIGLVENAFKAASVPGTPKSCP
jgi:predicted TIM-barrel fold metal-dependent hydrolase